MNPFKYGCIVNGDFFCQRPVLERELRRLIESGQNVVIQGERRMGKTSLVCEAVRKTHGVKLLYVDLMGVKSVADFCRKVTVAVTALDRRRGFLSKTADLLRRLRLDGRRLPRDHPSVARRDRGDGEGVRRSARISR